MHSIRKITSLNVFLAHFFAVKSLGSWMIRNWGFYEGSRLGEFLRKKGVYHPEDQAAFLVIGYYRFLNNLPMEEEKRINEFQKKRKAAGTQRTERTSRKHIFLLPPPLFAAR